MKTDPLFVSSSTPTLEALEIMQSKSDWLLAGSR